MKLISYQIRTIGLHALSYLYAELMNTYCAQHVRSDTFVPVMPIVSFPVCLAWIRIIPKAGQSRFHQLPHYPIHCYKLVNNIILGPVFLDKVVIVLVPGACQRKQSVDVLLKVAKLVRCPCVIHN